MGGENTRRLFGLSRLSLSGRVSVCRADFRRWAVDRSIRAIPYEELMESSSRHPPARAAREMQARFASIFVLLAALIDHALVNPPGTA